MIHGRTKISSRKRLFMLATAIVLPSLGVAIAKFGVPLPGPSIAAATSSSGASLPTLTGITAGPERLAIEAIFRTAAAEPFGTSPIFTEPEREVAPSVEVMDEPEPEIEPSQGQPVEIPPLTLSSVMGSPARPMAVIDGRLRGVGDVVVRGWRIDSINIETGEVVVRFGEAKLVLKLPPRGVIPR